MALTAELRLWWQYAPAEIERLFEEWREGGRLEFEERTDLYLLDSRQAQVGIKLRNQAARSGGAEIKTLVARLGSHGPCTAELWVKAASAALSLGGQPTAKVRKRRRVMRFRIRDGRVEDPPGAAASGDLEGCDVEWTEVSRDANSARWWTLGFEASGTLGKIEDNLSLSLARVLPRIPQSVFAEGVCGSYPAWLSGFRAEDG